MPKIGRQSSVLIPQFLAKVSRKLKECFSTGTAEEFLGLAATQDLVSFARALGVTPQLLEQALQVARNTVDPEFLNKLTFSSRADIMSRLISLRTTTSSSKFSTELSA